MLPNSQETVDLVTFTKEILNGKLHVCAVISPNFVPQLNLDLNLSEFYFHIVKIYLKLSEYYPNFTGLQLTQVISKVSLLTH